VVRHVEMRHHGEHVGVARQRVDSYSIDGALRIKLL
jgi:hypothetical protein